MLTRLIPAIYIGIIEVTLWLALVISGLVGYINAVPAARSAGLIIANETAWRIGGAALSVAATFLIAVVVTGPLLVLVDIRRSVKAIEASDADSNAEDPRTERTEPTLQH
jgi:hypothetical protein